MFRIFSVKHIALNRQVNNVTYEAKNVLVSKFLCEGHLNAIKVSILIILNKNIIKIFLKVKCHFKWL